MLDALYDLEYALRSNKRNGTKEQLTLQEENVLNSWRTRAGRDAVAAIGGGSIITWLAIPRLRYLLPASLTLPTPGLRFLFRVNISLFAGITCGLRQANKSVNSAIEHILALEGSGMQGELASIMLKKYKDDPWVVSHLSKYFYSEEVYDDSSTDKPTNRWRARNSFGDAISEKEIHDADPQPRRVHVNDAPPPMESSPLDIILGIPETVENSTAVAPPTTLTRRQRRRQRWSRQHQQD